MVKVNDFFAFDALPEVGSKQLSVSNAVKGVSQTLYVHLKENISAVYFF